MAPFCRMFFEYLERMRSRPRADRERFTLMTSLALTGVIALLWLVSLAATRGFGHSSSEGEVLAGEPQANGGWDNLYPGAPRSADRESSRLQELMDAMGKPPTILPDMVATDAGTTSTSTVASTTDPYATQDSALVSTSTRQQADFGSSTPLAATTSAPFAPARSESGSDTYSPRDPFSPTP